MDIDASKLMKNAEKFQETMKGLNKKVSKIRVTGSVGGGMVEVDMDGDNKMLAVRIDSDTMGDREMLQDLIMAAYNAASEKVKEAVNNEIGSIVGDISKLLPKDLSTLKF